MGDPVVEDLIFRSCATGSDSAEPADDSGEVKALAEPVAHGNLVADLAREFSAADHSLLHVA